MKQIENLITVHVVLIVPLTKQKTKYLGIISTSNGMNTYKIQ